MSKTINRTILNSENVEHLFLQCLSDDQKESNNEDTIIVEGLTAKYAFNIAEIQANKELIIYWLNQLSKSFWQGDSFLSFCKKGNGDLWTTTHLYGELLMVLGMAVGNVEYCQKDRNTWVFMPGGVPYIKINFDYV